MPTRTPLDPTLCTMPLQASHVASASPASSRLAQGTVVFFRVQGKDMSGEVQGIAMTEAPGIGCTYIIKLDQDLSPVYAYSHVAISASMLAVVN